MEDLAGKINELLSDPQAIQQLNSLAASLGLGNSAPNTSPSAEQNNNTSNPLQGLDLNNLAQLLGGANSGDGNISSPPGNSGTGGLDASKLASLLSGLGGSGGGGGGLGNLAGLLGGGGEGLGGIANLLGGGGLGNLAGLLGGGGGGGVDGDVLKTVTKLLPLLSAFRQEDNNTRLLHALRPLLGPERQKKLDEAARMLSMLRMLPLLKGQGIL